MIDIIRSKANCIEIDTTSYKKAKWLIVEAWDKMDEGDVLLIYNTNPYLKDLQQTGHVYRTIHQIDGPPKFTLNEGYGVTVIRKTGQLEWRTGEIEWEGFELLRETILQLKPEDEIKKIIESW